jgi:pSer/pThr/pTyr-binding forkhead associated (FHA) protein
MALTVVVRSSGAEAPPEISFDAPRVVIGRGDGCDVRLPDASVSHRHASIRQRGTEYILLDEGSTNGTFVGPVRLSAQAPRLLRSGELVRLGRIWIEVRIEHKPATQNPALATAQIALGLVQVALADQGESAWARLRVTEGPDQGREASLTHSDVPHAIGRGNDVALKLEDADASRRHVEVFRRGTELFVRDLGSKNGSRLGDRPLEPNKPVLWPESQPLWIGKDRITFEDPAREALAELERAADERMRDDDSVDPPPGKSEPDEPSPSPPPDPEPRAQAAAERAAPIAQVPRVSDRPATSGKRWSGTDVLVALLAIVVMALSLLGLMWLFRSQ